MSKSRNLFYSHPTHCYCNQSTPILISQFGFLLDNLNVTISVKTNRFLSPNKQKTSKKKIPS